MRIDRFANRVRRPLLRVIDLFQAVDERLEQVLKLRDLILGCERVTIRVIRRILMNRMDDGVGARDATVHDFEAFLRGSRSSSRRLTRITP